jgi:Helix-hairpin-helix motif
MPPRSDPSNYFIRRAVARRAATAVFAAALTAISPHTSALDINQATLAELERFKGLGPAIAGQILTERRQAVFHDWNDVQRRVSGLGSQRTEKLRKAGLSVGTQAEAARAESNAAPNPQSLREGRLKDSPQATADRPPAPRWPASDPLGPSSPLSSP